MTEEKNVKPLNIDLSLKKNNVDEFFFNLSENPEGFKNKDFRYTLSLIYQLVEDEFEGIFLSAFCARIPLHVSVNELKIPPPDM